MRILMISDFYYPFAGGVEQHVRTLSTALVERGYDVAVATLGLDDLPDFEIDRGVRVHRIKGSAQRLARLFSHPGRPWAPPMPDPELTLSLRRVVERERPDIVHGHDWLVRSFLPLKKWSGAKLVVSLHYYTLTCAKKNMMYEGAPCSGPGARKCRRCASAHYGAAKGLPTLLGNTLTALAERGAVDMFIPVSHATAEGNGLADSSLPFEVIPNFVPASDGTRHAGLEPYISQLPDRGYLLFVGDLRRDKGLNVLLDAYASLDTDVPLVLIGKIWPETPKSFPPNVVVLENWPNHAVMEAWRRSSMALVPSVWAEPFGIVVIEAMASGVPVVASRIGGIPDIVVDGETGFLVPANNSSALAAAMERLLGDPSLMDRMGQAGKRRSRQFEVGAVVPRIERVYETLAGSVLPSEQTISKASNGRVPHDVEAVSSGIEDRS